MGCVLDTYSLEWEFSEYDHHWYFVQKSRVLLNAYREWSAIDLDVDSDSFQQTLNQDEKTP